MSAPLDRARVDPVLVTGASGFAGRHLIDLLAGDGIAVIGWYRPGSTPPSGTPIAWVGVDLLDAAAVRRAVAESRPAIVYHCAGASHPGASWTAAAHALEVNVLGTHHLFEAVRHARLTCRVLLPGSALVYRPSDRPLTEASPVGPTSPYGTSKLAQELLGASAAAVDGLAVYLTRSFNHIGPGQDPSFSTSSFARQLARIEAGLQEPVIHVGNLDARRDMTDVRDVVRAYRTIVTHGRPGRLYNVCSGEAYRIADILQRLVDQARARVEIRTDPQRMRPSDVPLVLGDARRLREETGWTPEVPIDRTLRELLDDWRQRTREGR